MNKKILISLLFILLTGWIGGCAYWYDFKIKKNFETGLINDFLSDSYEEVSNYELEEIKITKPSFSISDGGIIISESLDNISFISGTAEMETPDSMEEGLNQLATYLKKNPNKKLKIKGLHSNTDNSDSLVKARVNSVVSYLETKKGITENRIIVSTSCSEGLYQKTIGGLEYEIITNIEPTVEEGFVSTIDPNLKRRVKRRQIMQYPLTHFEIEPTYDLEKYFKHLKLYFDQNPEGLVQITGHTALKINDSLNRYHSKKYAEKVKKYLISEYGMNPRNFRVKGRGDSRPLSSSETDLGRTKNRRIEFSFIK